MEQSQETLKIKDLPVIGKIARGLDQSVGELGLHQAMKKRVLESGTKYEVGGLTPETQEVLEHRPVILVCNHRHDAESIALLAALPPRKAVSIIASVGQIGIGENIAKYLIPVYISHNEQGKNLKMSVRISKRFKIAPKFSELEEAKRNIKSMHLAAERVKQGQMVVIFPEGPLGKEGKWLSGVGHLIKEVGADSDAFLVMANVRGTTDLDLLRTLPLVSKVLPKIRVDFAKPKKLSEVLQGNLKPRDIVASEESRYNAWTLSINEK